MRKLFFLISGVVLVSCGGDDGGVTPKTSIELKATEVLIANGVNAKTTAEFTASASWTIEVDNMGAAWLNLSKKSGEAGDVKITITAKATNPAAAERAASLTVKCGSLTKRITVIQKENTLIIDKSALSLYTSSLTQSLKISSNIDWNITGLDAQNWCSVTPTSGTAGVTEITVTAPKNTTKSLRTLTLQVNSQLTAQPIAVSQPYIYDDGEYILYQDNTKGDNPIYLVFMGDGYIEEDYIQGNDFDKHMEEGIEAFLGIEPYPTYREYFKVYKVAAHSKERGMSGLNWGTRDTKFKTIRPEAYPSFFCLTDLVCEYALKIPEITTLNDLTIVLAVNANEYGGGCQLWNSGLSISTAGVSRSADERNSFANLVMHESGGHGFGQLGDEYFYGTPTITPDQITGFREDEKYGLWKNLDLTKNPDEVKWKSFFTESGYEAVGMYEGGFYFAFGVWRPEEISCMVDNRRYYNAPSREAIVQRIMKLSGGTYNRADFIANDKQKSMPAAMQRLNKKLDQTPFIPLPPPIIMK